MAKRKRVCVLFFCLFCKRKKKHNWKLLQSSAATAFVESKWSEHIMMCYDLPTTYDLQFTTTMATRTTMTTTMTTPIYKVQTYHCPKGKQNTWRTYVFGIKSFHIMEIIIQAIYDVSQLSWCRRFGGSEKNKIWNVITKNVRCQYKHTMIQMDKDHIKCITYEQGASWK